jgi:hypothetical protein
VPFFDQLHAQPDTRQWFDAAQRFAFALVETIEFLRSRMPGYPTLLIPDLVAGATRVRADGFWDTRFPWELETRRVGLQLKHQPDLLAMALNLPDGGREAYAALSEVSSALHETEAWRGFAEAHARLGEAEQDEARALRREYEDAVSESRVDAIAGDTGMRSAAFRRAELERVKRKASQILCGYFAAFARVDEVIDAIAAFVTQRVAKGPFEELQPFEAEWSLPADLRHVRFNAPDVELFRVPYELVKATVAVRSLSGIVLLRNVSSRQNEGRIVLTAEGRLLTGSAGIPAALTA